MQDPDHIIKTFSDDEDDDGWEIIEIPEIKSEKNELIFSTEFESQVDPKDDVNVGIDDEIDENYEYDENFQFENKMKNEKFGEIVENIPFGVDSQNGDNIDIKGDENYVENNHANTFNFDLVDDVISNHQSNLLNNQKNSQRLLLNTLDVNGNLVESINSKDEFNLMDTATREKWEQLSPISDNSKKESSDHYSNLLISKLTDSNIVSSEDSTTISIRSTDDDDNDDLMNAIDLSMNQEVIFDVKNNLVETDIFMIHEDSDVLNESNELKNDLFPDSSVIKEYNIEFLNPKLIDFEDLPPISPTLQNGSLEEFGKLFESSKNESLDQISNEREKLIEEQIENPIEIQIESEIDNQSNSIDTIPKILIETQTNNFVENLESKDNLIIPDRIVNLNPHENIENNEIINKNKDQLKLDDSLNKKSIKEINSQLNQLKISSKHDNNFSACFFGYKKEIARVVEYLQLDMLFNPHAHNFNLFMNWVLAFSCYTFYQFFFGGNIIESPLKN